ncbi:RNA-binding region RNP-1 domain-containing protein [Tieghemostelium lacteum]|uniref:RNA-binding region RNP-1 domain-containing protein n=1 Tax=Tieghemostelium lacteum TaxID=361077 RepID=A0A151Z845_TIELA|nr:RNA-binding region RNP-1 domain-containing protein [Tieghemostelium lacteum]|eukprot:KYQ90105.1 RNA-binding region RNP-1 domain-containing protein [Tieghemostelium lacteum]
MNTIREIQKINERELQLNLGKESASWHNDYSHSPYIHVRGLDYGLTEGDIISMFSQYGEIFECNLVRDKETKKSQGFAFIGYEDQRSTNLAVDNLNGITVLNRIIKVDHVKEYRKPKPEDEKKKDQHKPYRQESSSSSNYKRDSYRERDRDRDREYKYDRENDRDRERYRDYDRDRYKSSSSGGRDRERDKPYYR